MSKKIILMLFLVAIASFGFAASVEINGGAPMTSDRDVTVSYSGLNADANVCLTTTHTLSSCGNTSSWTLTGPSGSDTLTLSTGDGSKSVYLYALDADHNTDDPITASDTITLHTTGPTITINSPEEGSDTNSTSVEFDYDITDTNGVVSSSIVITIDGVEEDLSATTGTITDGINVNFTKTLTSKEYSVTIEAEDELGNTASEDYNFIVDTVKPTSPAITNSYKTSYTNDTAPEFTITGTDTLSGFSNGKARLSCSVGFSTYKEISLTGNSTTSSDFDITSSSYGCTNSDGNKIVYVKIRDSAGNWADANAKTNVLLDTVEPEAPTNITLKAGDEEVNVSWDEADDDDRSGNDYYKIYVYDGSSLEKTVSNIDIDDTDKDVTGLDNDTEYDFKVCTVDKAGNEDCADKESATPAGTTASIAVKKAGVVTEYAKNNDTLDITCTYSDDVDDAIITAKTYEPTGAEDTIKETSSTVKTLTYSFKLTNASYGKIDFFCKADGTSTAKKEITIDNNAPKIDWIDTNNQFVGAKKITLSVIENKLIDKVQIDFNGSLFTATKDTTAQNKYYFDLNTTLFENKDYNLKAIAIDKAGNSSQITKIVTVSNLSSSKQMAIKNIELAQEKQKIAIDQINYYATEGLTLNETLKTKKMQADALLASAKVALDVNNDLSLEKAIKSLALFEEFINESKVETLETKTYTIDTNKLIESLKGNGLSDKEALTQQELIGNSEIERKLSILKTGNEDKRQVIIEISFINDTNSDVVKIIEIIPKELMETALNLISDVNYRIIQDDPIVEFTVNAPTGSKASFSYGTGEISKAEADKIIQDNVVQKFTVPPLIAESGTTAEEVLGTNSNLMSIIIAVIVLIVIVVVLGILVGAVLFTKFIGAGHGFGEQKAIIDHIAPKKVEPAKKGWKAK